MQFVAFNDLSPALRQAAWQLYETSFPDYERRSRPAQQAALGDSLAHGDLLIDEEGRLAALCFYWTRADLLYVEFLAVDPAIRGRQLGSRIVNDLLARYPGYTAVLEIEPPEDELTCRRLRFYERLGFRTNDFPYTHPSYRTGAAAHPHRLVVMSHGDVLTPDRREEFLALMRDVVLRYAD